MGVFPVAVAVATILSSPCRLSISGASCARKASLRMRSSSRGKSARRPQAELRSTIPTTVTCRSCDAIRASRQRVRFSSTLPTKSSAAVCTPNDRKSVASIRSRWRVVRSIDATMHGARRGTGTSRRSITVAVAKSTKLLMRNGARTRSWRAPLQTCRVSLAKRHASHDFLPMAKRSTIASRTSGHAAASHHSTSDYARSRRPRLIFHRRFIKFERRWSVRFYPIACRRLGRDAKAPDAGARAIGHGPHAA